MPRTFSNEIVLKEGVHKFVRVGDEYRFCDIRSNINHCDMVSQKEHADAAGIISIMDEYWYMACWMSMTLGIGCGQREVYEITKLLGLRMACQ